MMLALLLIPKNITIIPKIESPDGITNVSEIVKAIPSQEKILMLDHDDLFSALTKLGEQPSKFKDYINELQLKENTISCKNVNFRLFGFSLATINFFLSIFLLH